MYELQIFRQDGSNYWNTSFNDMEQLNYWLADAMTQSNWDPTFTTKIIDHTPPPPTPEEIAYQKMSQINTETTAAVYAVIGDINAPILTAWLSGSILLIDKALNLSGTQTVAEQNAAKSDLATYRNLFIQLKSVMDARAAKIALI